MKSISAKIDWLTITKQYDPEAFGMENVLLDGAVVIAQLCLQQVGLHEGSLISIKRNAFYEYAFQHTSTGVRVFVSSRLNEQGVMIVFDGKATNSVKSMQVVMRSAHRMGWKFTRCDVAWDILEGEDTAGSLADEFSEVIKAFPAKKWTVFHSPNGNTFYIGSRQSDVYIRIYDKGEQQRVDFQWLRLEVELKGDFLTSWQDSMSEAFLCITPEFLKRLRLEKTEAYQAIQSFAAGAAGSRRKVVASKSDRRLWLEGDVLSALEKLMVEEPDAAQDVLLLYLARAVERGIMHTDGDFYYPLRF